MSPEGTFDAYLYPVVESKQKFIGQTMTSKSPVRSVEDIDETALVIRGNQGAHSATWVYHHKRSFGH